MAGLRVDEDARDLREGALGGDPGSLGGAQELRSVLGRARVRSDLDLEAVGVQERDLRGLPLRDGGLLGSQGPLVVVFLCGYAMLLLHQITSVSAPRGPPGPGRGWVLL